MDPLDYWVRKMFFVSLLIAILIIAVLFYFFGDNLFSFIRGLLRCASSVSSIKI